MNIKNKYLIFVSGILFILFAIIAVVIVKKTLIKKDNSNNFTSSVIEHDKAYLEKIAKDTEKINEKAKTLKPYEPVDDIKVCDYRKDCLKDIFSKCTAGFGLFFVKNGSNILNINRLNSDNICDFYISNMGTNEKNFYCHVNKNELTDTLFDKIIESGVDSDFLVNDYKCVLNSK